MSVPEVIAPAFVPNLDDIDDVILFALGGDKVGTGEPGPLGVTIWDGLMKPFPLNDEGKAVVTYDLPYAVYTSNVGLDTHRRVCGGTARTSTFWAIQYVGADRWQTKWAGKRIRDALRGRLTVAGRRTGIPICDVSPRIWRDDDAIRPDGTPLYYGVDEYAVSAPRMTTGGP